MIHCDDAAMHESWAAQPTASFTTSYGVTFVARPMLGLERNEGPAGGGGGGGGGTARVSPSARYHDAVECEPDDCSRTW